MLTADRLRELLEYCPDTGVFRWLSDRRGGCKAGDVAGITYPKGYRFIKVDGVRYSAHRLAWLYMTGNWPTQCVDHINRQRDDNRFANLREATWSENRMNSTAAGVKYYPKARKWRAYIRRDGVQYHLGVYDTQEEAAAARATAALKYHGDFAAKVV